MPPNHAGRRPVPRRRVLGLGGGLLLGALAGCTDPRVGPDRGTVPTTPTRPGGTKPATSTPTLPGAAEAAAAEQAAAALAAALLGDRRVKLDRSAQRLVTAARDAHRDHAVVLAHPEPTTRPTTAPSAGTTPAPARPPRTVTVRALADTERALARRHAAAVPASRGLTALLWGSLSVAATTMAGALGARGPVPVAPARDRRAIPVVVADVAGVQAMVSQLHAAVYGYQVAIGRLAPGSERRERAVAGLAERRALRDRLTTFLIARQADVPVAAAAYVPSVRVTGPASAAALIAAVETALLPYAGQWLASATARREVEAAFAELGRTAGLARRWGGPVVRWPGWP